MLGPVPIPALKCFHKGGGKTFCGHHFLDILTDQVHMTKEHRQHGTMVVRKMCLILLNVLPSFQEPLIVLGNVMRKGIEGVFVDGFADFEVVAA